MSKAFMKVLPQFNLIFVVRGKIGVASFGGNGYVTTFLVDE